MTYLNFPASDVYVLLSDGATWSNADSVGISLNADKIDTVRFLEGDIPIAKITSTVESAIIITYVSATSTELLSLESNPNFITINGDKSYYQLFNNEWAETNTKIIVNRSSITSVSQTPNLIGGSTQYLWQIFYVEGPAVSIVNTNSSIAASLNNQGEEVLSQPATEIISVNPLSFCWDITVVNHATGTTNTIHTPLNASDYNVDSTVWVVPFGGFMAVFTNNLLSRTFIYFIDNDGNLVDQIDGAGPGYQWGAIDFRLVWAADNDNTSVLKIFDGKNVRTYEFPYVADFILDPWSEGDSSKNLCVPFVVNNMEIMESNLYMSTPGSGLIDLGIDSWYDNEAWSTIHPTSDKILKCTWADQIYGALEVYSEDGIKINSFDLSSYNVNDYNDRNYYGANGDFLTIFYNFDDNTVPYLFVAYKAATNTFATFTSEDAVNGYVANYLDHEVYEDNVAAANTLSVIIGVTTLGTITGMDLYTSGGTIHWVPANGTEWLSYEINEGAAFQISTGDGRSGAYPLFVVTLDRLNDNLWSLILQEDGSTIIDTSILTADVTGLSTFSLGNNTLTAIDNNADCSWFLYGNNPYPEYSITTSQNFDWHLNGGTVVLIDLDNSANSWSWTTAGGFIPAPTANDSFELVDAVTGGYWNPFGYPTNGKQVLLDINNSNNVVGFYFLSEDNTEWVYAVNTWDDVSTRDFDKGLSTFGYITYNDNAGAYYYMNYDMTTGAFISGGSTSIPGGDTYYLNAVGDRISAVIFLPSGEKEINCFTSAGIVKVTIPNGVAWETAFNDAKWSWDNY
jgi:hypothetical protein